MNNLLRTSILLALTATATVASARCDTATHRYVDYNTGSPFGLGGGGHCTPDGVPPHTHGPGGQMLFRDGYVGGYNTAGFQNRGFDGYGYGTGGNSASLPAPERRGRAEAKFGVFGNSAKSEEAMDARYSKVGSCVYYTDPKAKRGDRPTLVAGVFPCM